ncbi:carbonic anhydrase [Methyloceanibacter sp.]|uniref:carbonic anhydrase n=1 Tax=Methyloceanibacter sp. TaxID=1965321 RepID=UPI002D3790F9|nr:carbonic anhydrase [Methyloceanibacter sp.]HZP07926.1 carbonic anhydrase [Methyloceanibacter sp.]
MCERCEHNENRLSRRHVMAGGAALLAASSLPWAFARADQPVLAGPPPNAIPPDEALNRLMAGNARYAAGATECKDYSLDRAERVGAQYPIVAVLSCSDSRVSPELLFEQGPGDIFVVRVAGNFVNPDGLASMEYAVKILGVPLLMVLGHSNCGAVSAAVKVVTEHAELPGHLPELVQSIEPAVIAAHDKHTPDLVAATIDENVRLNVKRLIDDTPIISDALAAKKIAVSGGVYDIATGKVRLI